MAPKIIALIVAVILLVAIYYADETSKKITHFVMDKVSLNRINQLHPAIRDKAIQMLIKAEKMGIKLRVTETVRDYWRQAELYNQPTDGKDNDGDGKIDEPDEKVTNAKPGQSYHNFALAFDVVPIDKDGKAIWDATDPVWKKVGSLGESLGLEWGGRWKFLDLPHFQIANISLSKLAKLYHDKNLDEKGFVNLT